MDAPFWKTKTLEEMSPTEWESLCDGCGRCCLVKLEDEDSGRIFATDVGCRLFEAGTCRTAWRTPRPIPEDDDFFENVWRSYRETGNID